MSRSNVDACCFVTRGSSHNDDDDDDDDDVCAFAAVDDNVDDEVRVRASVDAPSTSICVLLAAVV